MKQKGNNPAWSWVFVHPRIALATLFNQNLHWRTWFPQIRAGLLLAVIPFWFMTTESTAFWLAVIALVAMYLGAKVGQSDMIKYNINAYVRSLLAAAFWVAVARLLLIAVAFFFFQGG